MSGETTSREQTRQETINRKPAAASSYAAIFLSLLAAAVLVLGSLVGATIAAVGALITTVSVYRGRQKGVTLGALVTTGAIVAAGVLGAPPAPLLGATGCAILAWDIGSSAIDIGQTLGHNADTARLEAVRAAFSLFVTSTTATVGYAIYVLAGDGQPMTALVLLILGAVIIIAVYRQ